MNTIRTTLHLGYVNVKKRKTLEYFFFGWSKVLLLMLCSCRVARQALRQTAHDRTEPNQKQRKEELL